MQSPAGKQNKSRTDLDERYHEIGISAVAAALRYRGEPKNPAYAPVAPRADQPDEDAA